MLSCIIPVCLAGTAKNDGCTREKTVVNVVIKVVFAPVKVVLKSFLKTFLTRLSFTGRDTKTTLGTTTNSFVNFVLKANLGAVISILVL